ncbi:hypothetical protein [Flavobacterium chungangense]|uniref:Uncharacterized protein n=1 Tax=Flavobacterium chungangense TaxID=554283 RepID=A0A6V6YYJ0_9FLAO|nr:hypothetical protein [Flavobacterium chungangense]CAD0004476.1 hypothetical protein FLACHUCJ7_01880 [Flavobacterium chungangense]
MKKLLLFLVLAVTFNLSAQTISTTYFAKPLELNSVPASTTKADSVLVRGTDKIIKYVPRSEFGGGGSQDLPQTLANGSTATGISNFVVSGSNGSVSLSEFGAEISNNAYGQLAVSPNGIVIQNRGNSNPIQIQGNSAGVNVTGSMGAQLEMPNSGVVKLHSNQGLNINNYSSNPLNIYSTTKTEIQGVAGLELRSQSAYVDMIAPKVEMFGNGQSNKITTNDESGRVSMTSTSGGVDISSTGGYVDIRSPYSGINVGNINDNSPLYFNTGGYCQLKSGGILSMESDNQIYSISPRVSMNTTSSSNFSLADSGAVYLNSSNSQPMYFSASGNDIGLFSSRLIIGGYSQLGEFNVSGLPIPSSSAYATVIDALDPENGQIPVGEGAVKVPVFFNGIDWRIISGGSSGSESQTNIIAGANISITGTGTTPDPYIINYMPPYRVYRALLTQNGTNAPTAIVLENTLGGDVVWSRDGAGIYIGDLVGATSEQNKTFITVGRTISNFYCVAKAFTNSFFVGSVDKDVPGGTDSYLNKMPVEIIVYN